MPPGPDSQPFPQAEPAASRPAAPSTIGVLASLGSDADNPTDARAAERWTSRHAAWMLVALATAVASGRVLWVSIAGAASIAGLIYLSRASFGGLRSFGAANWVTSLRVLLSVALGQAFDLEAPETCALLALAIFSLDGVDGYLAKRERRTAAGSAFGAQFDMESDALFTMVLALGLLELDRAGAWVLLAGILRYVYVLWTGILPRANREAPRTRLGRFVFSIVVTGFTASLWPAQSISQILCAVSTLCLLYSFGHSFWWSLLDHGEVHDPAEHGQEQ